MAEDRVKIILHMTARYPDHVKIWLTSVNYFLPKFCPKVTHPIHLSIGDILWFDGKLQPNSEI